MNQLETVFFEGKKGKSIGSCLGNRASAADISYPYVICFASSSWTLWKKTPSEAHTFISKWNIYIQHIMLSYRILLDSKYLFIGIWLRLIVCSDNGSTSHKSHPIRQRLNTLYHTSQSRSHLFWMSESFVHFPEWGLIQTII